MANRGRRQWMRLGAAGLRLLRQQQSVVSPGAMLVAIGALSVLLVVSGVWHTSKVVPLTHATET